MTNVGVLGARGRMGREVVRTVTGTPDLEVAAEVLTRPKALAVVGPFDDAAAFQIP